MKKTPVVGGQEEHHVSGLYNILITYISWCAASSLLLQRGAAFHTPSTPTLHAQGFTISSISCKWLLKTTLFQCHPRTATRGVEEPLLLPGGNQTLFA